MTEQHNPEFDSAFDDAFRDSQDSQAESGETGNENDTETRTDTDTDEGTQSHDHQQEASDEQEQRDGDIWATAPEPLRNEYQKQLQELQTLQSNYQAVTGRLAPTQRELDSTQKKLREMEQKLADMQKAGSDKAQAAPDADQLEGMSDEEIEQEWPEFAKALKRRDQLLNEQKQQLSALQKQLEPINEFKQQVDSERQERFKQAELTKVSAAHPDYKSVISEPKFAQWFNSAPPSVQMMAQSLNADDNIAMLNLYKMQAGIPSPTTDQRKPAKPDLSDHVQVPRSGSGAPAVMRKTGDFDSEFDHAMRNG